MRSLVLFGEANAIEKWYQWENSKPRWYHYEYSLINYHFQP